MKAWITGIFLVVLLLAQASRTSLLLQWQQLANESFTEMFCVNKAWEDAPMCLGSCQLPDLFEAMTTDDAGDELSSSPNSPTALYCQLPVKPLTDSPQPPPVARAAKPATVPFYAPRGYIGAVFEPPMA